MGFLYSTGLQLTLMPLSHFFNTRKSGIYKAPSWEGVGREFCFVIGHSSLLLGISQVHHRHSIGNFPA
jgi:hypothetical protein